MCKLLLPSNILFSMAWCTHLVFNLGGVLVCNRYRWSCLWVKVPSAWPDTRLHMRVFAPLGNQHLLTFSNKPPESILSIVCLFLILPLNELPVMRGQNNWVWLRSPAAVGWTWVSPLRAATIQDTSVCCAVRQSPSFRHTHKHAFVCPENYFVYQIFYFSSFFRVFLNF